MKKEVVKKEVMMEEGKVVVVREVVKMVVA